MRLQVGVISICKGRCGEERRLPFVFFQRFQLLRRCFIYPGVPGVDFVNAGASCSNPPGLRFEVVENFGPVVCAWKHPDELLRSCHKSKRSAVHCLVHEELVLHEAHVAGAFDGGVLARVAVQDQDVARVVVNQAGLRRPELLFLLLSSHWSTIVFLPHFVPFTLASFSRALRIKGSSHVRSRLPPGAL